MQYCWNVASEKVYLYKFAKDKQICCNQWTVQERRSQSNIPGRYGPGLLLIITTFINTRRSFPR